MKYWTVQSQEVLEIIEKEGAYYPVFAKSQYNKQYKELYNFMLKSFNNINNTNCDGLIYAFCISVKDMIYPIANIEEFRYFININKDKINFLWDTFKKNNCKILELDVNFEFNDLALSFNDFQYIMPHSFQYIMPHSFNKILFNPDEYQYNCEYEYQYNCELIRSNINKGIIMSSGKEYDLIQSHLPYIKKSDINNVYELFGLD